MTVSFTGALDAAVSGTLDIDSFVRLSLYTSSSIVFYRSHCGLMQENTVKVC